VRFEVFMAMKIQIKVFWVVEMYSVVVGYQLPPTPHPLVLQAYIYALTPSVIHFTLKMETARSTETLVS
jgi:hypothetical protein